MVAIEVYVPVPGRLEQIADGSGIVGTRLEDGRVRIDFEGNLHGAVNVVTYADRVEIACGRHQVSYPTVARMSVPAADVAAVGVFDPETGVVTVTAPDLLTGWLGGEPGAEQLRTSRAAQAHLRPPTPPTYRR